MRGYNMPELRADKKGTHRVAFDRNKRKLLKIANTCGICGKPIDKSLKYPHPLSASVDHILPISRGGHPSAFDNLHLTHLQCNLQKSNKVYSEDKQQPKIIGNRNLPQTMDWTKYRSRG